MITNQIYGGGKENLDQELNTQDTLLETLKTDIEALPSAGGQSSDVDTLYSGNYYDILDDYTIQQAMTGNYRIGEK